MREELGEVRHEFVDGEVFAMAGGTPEHAAIVAAVTMELAHLRGGPCRAFVTDLRTRIRADERGPEVATYPDIAIVCGPVVRDPEDPIAIVNPTVLVEVLSQSTEAYDRHGKFAHYQRLASLKEYVLVSQHEPKLELFTKQGGSWGLSSSAGPGDRISLSSVPAALDVSKIYDGLIGSDGRIRIA